MFVTDFFSLCVAQWKVFVGVLCLLLIFHMVVSFIFGRLPTSKMLSGMAIEFAEKKKLGVLLVIHSEHQLNFFFCALPHLLLIPPLFSIISVFRRDETASFGQGVL